MDLTKSQIRYLIAIYRLTVDDNGVSSAKIAQELRISRPSVSRMLEELCRREVIQKAKYGAVFLTPLGREVGSICHYRMIRLTEELEKTLLLTPDIASKAALAAICEMLWDLEGNQSQNDATFK